MPKQLHFVPNERVDLEDLTYGTSTFSVDEFKSHVQRLLTGDYHGGFILDGFRVEITDAITREIRVHNGIALDREGRLITFEDGDNFSHNIDSPKTLTLDAAAGNDIYISIEFELLDSDSDTRAIWDPTFENPNIVDSANNQHASPNGKEFPLNIPTRRAKSWRVIQQTGGPFTDTTDPGTGALTLSIPLAILPLSGGSAIDVPDLEKPWTTIIETPQADATTLVCANTRLFAEGGALIIKNKNDGSLAIPAIPGELVYLGNDSNNNAINFTNGGTDLEEVAVGDIVEAFREGAATISDTFVKAGSQYDCRPMLFSFTDPTAGSFETSAVRRAPRNERYGAGAALLQDNISSKTLTAYPDATNTDFRRMVAEEPARVENDLKQSQDFFRALGTIIREVKYGETVDIKAQGAQPSVSGVDTSTSFTFAFTSLHPDWVGDLPAKLVGSTITVATSPGISPPVDSTAVVTAVDTVAPGFVLGADEATVIKITVAPDTVGPPPWGAGDIPQIGMQFNITKGVASDTKYVDNYQTGNLHEVYKARIDKVANTWTSDLQERLRANKIPIVTVGDGINTFGDYIGDGGLSQALQDIAQPRNGGIIYVKRGSYTIDGEFPIYSNTTIMGEGADATTITFATTSTVLLLASFTAQVENVRFQDISIIAGTYAGGGIRTGKGAVVTNLTPAAAFPSSVINLVIDNCYMQGGSYYNNTAPAADQEKRDYSILNLEINNTDAIANEGIKILNSRFFVEGSGFYLQDCRNVQIEGCIFETETTDGGAAVGLVEGIVFDGGVGIPGWEYGYDAATRAFVAGEVRVSNCKFRGRHTTLSVLPYRGWIFFTPTFTGQNSSVTDCQFIGDNVGTNSNPTILPRYKTAFIHEGIGIVSESTEVVLISGCMFHSYKEGIRSGIGKTIVSDCSFLMCENGVVIGQPNVGASTFNFEYQDVNSTWEVADPNLDFITEITNCSFTHWNIYDAIGINILPQQSWLNGIITIRGCNFSNITNSISYKELSDHTSALASFGSEHYQNITIDSCTHNMIGAACVLGEYATNQIAAASNAREWAIRSLTYTNNSHDNLQLNNTGDDVINLSSRECIVRGNTVQNVVITIGLGANTEHIFRLFMPNHLVFDNNTLMECYPTAVSAVNTIQVAVHLGSSFPDLDMRNNTLSVGGSAASRGISNGIYIGSPTPHNHAIFANLRLSDNKIDLKNANYVFLADQNSGASLDKLFVWENAEVTNNKISNDIDISATGGFLSYGNDALYELVDFPGAGTAPYLGACSEYCGILDLRLFNNPSGPNPNSFCIVDNNSIVVTGSNLAFFDTSFSAPLPAGITTSKDLQKLVGIRLSSWPRKVSVCGNRIAGAPVILNDNFWNGRNDSTRTTTGAKIKFNNNSIASGVHGGGDTGPGFGCLVDITPASGGNQPGIAVTGNPGIVSSTNASRGVSITMCGNDFEDYNAQDGCASYQNLMNVIRFGQLRNQYKFQPVAGILDDEIDTPNLRFNWLISNNQFEGMHIIIEGNGNTGGTSGTHMNDLTVTDDPANPFGGNATLPAGSRLIVVENNNFVFGVDAAYGTGAAFRPWKIFATDKLLGIARFYVGYTGLASPSSGAFSTIYQENLLKYPDSVATSVSGALDYIISSYLIVQNNSCVANTGFGQGVEVAFTGSRLNQG